MGRCTSTASAISPNARRSPPKNNPCSIKKRKPRKIKRPTKRRLTKNPKRSPIRNLIRNPARSRNRRKTPATAVTPTKRASRPPPREPPDEDPNAHLPRRASPGSSDVSGNSSVVAIHHHQGLRHQRRQSFHASRTRHRKRHRNHPRRKNRSGRRQH